MTCQQNCQPLQLHGGFSVEQEICTVKLNTVEVLRRLFGSQRFLRNCPSPELPTLAVTRCHFGPDTQNWIPQKFYGQLSGVVAKLHTWAVSRRLFGHEKSIKSSGREINSRLAGWCAGLIDSLQIIPHGHGSSRNSNTNWLGNTKPWKPNIISVQKLKAFILHTISRVV